MLRSMPDSSRQFVRLRRLYVPLLDDLARHRRHMAIARLPFPGQLDRKAAGYAGLSFRAEQAACCETNLRLCFPEISEHELQQLKEDI